MLSDSERKAIEAELPLYERRRSLCIEALKIVQEHRGWVSDEAVADIAEFLGMGADEVDSVATFYNRIHRHETGRHVIYLCDSVSCWIMGCDRARERLRETLGIDFGETTPDGRFTLLPIACLGACDRAPALMVGDELYGPVDPAKAEEPLGKHP